MAKKTTTDIDIAKGFVELEEIAQWFERGEADLNQGIEKFERAMFLAEGLRKHLATAENRIRDIKKQYHLE